MPNCTLRTVVSKRIYPPFISSFFYRFSPNLFFLSGLLSRTLIAGAFLQIPHLCAGAIAVPIITAGGTTTFCEGASVVLTASPTGGGSYAGGTTYQWMKDASNISGATAAAYTATTSGSYTVKVTNGADNATSEAIAVTVNAKVPFTVSASTLGACPGAELVTWQLPIKCAISGNSITSTGGWNWEIGAESAQQIVGDGYMEHTLDNSNATRFIGLSPTNNLPSYTSIQYAFKFDGGYYISIHEYGVQKASFGQFTAGKKVRISIEDTHVHYYYDGQLLYTSTVSPTSSLVVDAAMYAPGTYFSNATVQRTGLGDPIVFTASPSSGGTYQWSVNNFALATAASTLSRSGLVPGDVVKAVFTPSTACVSNTVDSKTIIVQAPSPSVVSITAPTFGVCVQPENIVWQSPYQCSIVGSGLVGKGTSNWDAGAKSLQQITGDGYIEYVIENTTTSKRIGLSASTRATAQSIQYAIELEANGQVKVQESGVEKKTNGGFVAGKTVRVQVRDSVVTYYYDGQAFYTSLVKTGGPLVGHALLFNYGNSLSSAKIQRSNTSPGIVFTANGAEGSYQWRVNGKAVGENNPLFTGVGLLPSDVVQVTLTPDDNCLAASTDHKTIVSSPVSVPFSISASTLLVTPGTEPATWQYVKNASSSSGLVNTSGNSWDAGAESVQQVTGNGYVEYTVEGPVKDRILGLSPSNGNPTYSTVRYGFLLLSTGYFTVLESNSVKTSSYAYSTGDKLRVAVQSDSVRYFVNGQLLYTSKTATSGALVVSAVLNGVNGSLNGVLVQRSNTGSPITFTTNLTGGTYQWTVNGLPVGNGSGTLVQSGLLGGDIVKVIFNPTDPCYAVSYDSKTITSVPNAMAVTLTANTVQVCPGLEEVKWTGIQNSNITDSSLVSVQVDCKSNAYSTQAITGDGYFDYRVESLDKREVGLTTLSTVKDLYATHYAFFLFPNEEVSIREKNNIIKSLGPLQANKKIRISRTNGIVRYYYDGVLVYTNPIPNFDTLYLSGLPCQSHIPLTHVKIQRSNPNPVVFTAQPSGAAYYNWYVNGLRIDSTLSPTWSFNALPGDKVVCHVPSPSGSLVSSNEVSITSKPLVASSVSISSPDASVCPAPERVIWKNVQNCTLLGDRILNVTRPYPVGSTSGAESAQEITDHGYVEYTIETLSNYGKIIGLTTPHKDISSYSIKYGFYLTGNTLQVFQTPSSPLTVGPMQVGKKIRIALEDHVVRYYYDHKLVYSEMYLETSPLVIHAYLDEGDVFTDILVQRDNNDGTAVPFTASTSVPGTFQWYVNHRSVGNGTASLSQLGLVAHDQVRVDFYPSDACSARSSSNVLVVSSKQPLTSSITVTAPNLGVCPDKEPIVWQYPVGVSIQGPALTATTGNWGSSAESVQKIETNGWLEYTVEAATHQKALGLSPTNQNPSLESIAYGFRLENGIWTIIEEGGSVGITGTYNEGDVIRVGVDTRVVRYYFNGQLMYASQKLATLPLIVDVSLQTGSFSGLFIQQSNLSEIPLEFQCNGGGEGHYQWYVNSTTLVDKNKNTRINTLIPRDSVYAIFIPRDNCHAIAKSNKLVVQPVSPAPPASLTVVANELNVCAPLEQVAWQNLVNASYTDKLGIKSQASEIWQAGAESFQTIQSDGYVEYTIENTITSRAIGLSRSRPTDGSFGNIDFAFVLQSDGLLSIYEAGAYVILVGNYEVGEKVRMAVNNGVVRYYYSAKLVYESTVAPQLPLIVDLSIKDKWTVLEKAMIQKSGVGTSLPFKAMHSGTGLAQWFVNNLKVATGDSVSLAGLYPSDEVKAVWWPTQGCPVSSLKIIGTKVSYTNGVVPTTSVPRVCSPSQPAMWQNTYNAFVHGDTIESSGGNAWETGARSAQQMEDNGYVEYRLEAQAKSRMIGLTSIATTERGFGKIDYAILLGAGGDFSVMELNEQKMQLGAHYEAGKKIRIAIENKTVRYYYDGQVVYESRLVPTTPLVADMSLVESGSSFAHVVIARPDTSSVPFTTNTSPTYSYRWFVNHVPYGSQAGMQNIRGVMEGYKIDVIALSNDACVASSFAQVVMDSCSGNGSLFYRVTNNLDSGPGSLRAAITWANAHPDLSPITFNIPVDMSKVITITTPLDPIVTPVTIDASTQPGYDKATASTIVQLTNGSTQGNGLLFSGNSQGSVLKGFNLSNFTGWGIDVVVENIVLEDVEVK